MTTFPAFLATCTRDELIAVSSRLPVFEEPELRKAYFAEVGRRNDEALKREKRIMREQAVAAWKGK